MSERNTINSNDDEATEQARFDEVHAIVSALLVGEATSQQRARLEELVVRSPKCRRLYVRYVCASSSLRTWASGVASPPHPRTSAERLATLILENQAPLPMTDTPLSSPANRTVRYGTRFFIPQFLAARIGGIPRLAAGVLAATILLLVIGAWGISRKHPATGSPEQATRVATLRDARKAVWQPGHEPAAVLFAGQQLVLVSGVAEVLFDSGAAVTLEGPATLLLESAASAQMSNGKLSATVPPQARGFTIRTPLASVIDHGTRFRISVDPAGAKVRVDEGSVQLVKLQASATASDMRVEMASKDRGVTEPPLILRAGQSVRIDGANRLVTDASADDYQQLVLSLKPEIYLAMEGETEQRGEKENHQSQVPNLAAAGKAATIGGAGIASLVPGRVGQAIDCRGGASGNFVEVDVLPPFYNYTYTVAAWVRLGESKPVEHFIASHCWASRRGGLRLGIDESGRLFVGVVKQHGSARTGHYAPARVQEERPFPVGSWEHVAVVADGGAATLTLYHNGQIVGRREDTVLHVPWQRNPPPLYVGIGAMDATNRQTSGSWLGQLDEFVTWRRALSQQEVGLLWKEAPSLQTDGPSRAPAKK